MIEFVLPHVMGSLSIPVPTITDPRLRLMRTDPILFCGHDREFKGNVLARQLAVDRRERVELVLERSRVLRVEKPEIV